jgi:hypothetical protein
VPPKEHEDRRRHRSRRRPTVTLNAWRASASSVASTSAYSTSSRSATRCRCSFPESTRTSSSDRSMRDPRRFKFRDGHDVGVDRHLAVLEDRKSHFCNGEVVSHLVGEHARALRFSSAREDSRRRVYSVTASAVASSRHRLMRMKLVDRDRGVRLIGKLGQRPHPRAEGKRDCGCV